MKRIAYVFLLAACVALCIPQVAFAEHLTGSDDWKVTYTADGSMKDNFSSGGFADEVSDLLPGDDITLTVNLSHENSQAGDWYMANEILKSLEDGSSAAGSAYEYRLTYVAPDGASTVLYDSDTVGGDDSKGLADASSALEDYFYLDNLTQGQSAKVQLRVALDGETEGNDYFDTLASLKMKFAVEPGTSSSTTTTTNNTTPDSPSDRPKPTPSTGDPVKSDQVRNAVKTGDDTNLLPFYIALSASGLLLLVLGIDSVRLRRRDREEESR